MKNFKILLLTLLAALNCISSQKMLGDYFVCGQDNPTSFSDCNKYSTSSGFNCCYVTNITGQSNVCALVSYEALKVVKTSTLGKFECASGDKFIQMSVMFLAIAFMFLL